MGGAGREIGRTLACGQLAAVAGSLVLGALGLSPFALGGSLALQQLGPALFWAFVHALVAQGAGGLRPLGHAVLGVALGALAGTLQQSVFGPALRLAGTAADPSAPLAFLLFGAALGASCAATCDGRRYAAAVS